MNSNLLCPAGSLSFFELEPRIAPSALNAFSISPIESEEFTDHVILHLVDDGPVRITPISAYAQR